NQTNVSDFWPQSVGCYRVETTAASISNSNHFTPNDELSEAQISVDLSLEEQDSSTPTYSVAPAIGTRTTNSIPVTQTSTCSDCTAYVVAETSGLGAPTCTQIKAGKGADGNSAYKAANGSLTASVQLTLTLSSYTDGTVRDIYGCLNSSGS